MTDTVAFLRSGRIDGHSNFIPQIACADGFKMSVQAGRFLYSTPRLDRGPWTHVEVGFPSRKPQPWDEWRAYCEDPKRSTRTVYGYVPLEMVEALIALHGGEK